MKLQTLAEDMVDPRAYDTFVTLNLHHVVTIEARQLRPQLVMQAHVFVQ